MKKLLLVAVLATGILSMVAAAQDVRLPPGIVLKHENRTDRVRSTLVDSINVVVGLSPGAKVGVIAGIKVSTRVGFGGRFTGVLFEIGAICNNKRIVGADVLIADRPEASNDSILRLMQSHAHQLVDVDKAVEYESSVSEANGILVSIAGKAINTACGKSDDKSEFDNLHVAVLVWENPGNHYAATTWKIIHDSELWKKLQ